MTDQQSDNHIISLFFSRDESAISSVDMKYGHYLLTIAENILSDRNDCEECKNDTYLAIWNSIPPAQPHSFKAYIARVMHNVAINRYKEKKAKKRIPSEYTVCLDELAECVASSNDAESAVVARLLQQTINNFLARLPHRQRYIFVCRYYCGDSISSIAKDLHRSESMVFHELASIRKRLKVLLKQEGF